MPTDETTTLPDAPDEDALDTSDVEAALERLQAIHLRMANLRQKAETGAAIIDILEDAGAHNLPPDLLPLLKRRAEQFLEANPDAGNRLRLLGLKEEYNDAYKEAKEAIRNKPHTVEAHGWEASSRSGGFDYDFSPSVFVELELDNLEVDGQPLLQTVTTVNPAAYKMAVERRLVDQDALVEAGAVHIKARTRSTHIKRRP